MTTHDALALAEEIRALVWQPFNGSDDEGLGYQAPLSRLLTVRKLSGRLIAAIRYERKDRNG